MNQEKRLEILKALQADNPTPKTELEYHSNFELLIAVVLSAQATDKSVNEATRVLFPLANTPQAVLDLGPEKFTDIIKHIGLYRSKTKNVMKLCEDLIEHHNSQVLFPDFTVSLFSAFRLSVETAASNNVTSSGRSVMEILWNSDRP